MTNEVLDRRLNEFRPTSVVGGVLVNTLQQTTFQRH
jgi:hypothetical protein